MPPSLEGSKSSTKFRKLKKSLYGFKQFYRASFDTSAKAMKKFVSLSVRQIMYYFSKSPMKVKNPS